MAKSDQKTGESLPLGVTIAVGALAIFIVIVLLQTVLSALLGFLKVVLLIAVFAGAAMAVLSAKGNR